MKFFTFYCCLWFVKYLWSADCHSACSPTQRVCIESDLQSSFGTDFVVQFESQVELFFNRTSCICTDRFKLCYERPIGMNTLVFITDRINSDEIATATAYSQFMREIMSSWKHDASVCKNALYILVTLDQTYFDCENFCEEVDLIRTYIYSEQKPSRYLSTMEKYVMARNFNSHLAFFGVEFALQSLIADMEMFMDRSENDEASVVSRPVSMLMLLSLLISSALLIFLVTAMKAFFDLKKSNSINGNSPDRK